MKRIATIAGLLVLAAATGCPGPGSISGTVSGIKASVKDAAYVDLKDSSGKVQAALVILADKSNICDSIKASREPKEMTGLWMMLVQYGSDGYTQLPTEGDYTVTDTQPSQPGKYAQVLFVHTDANCNNALSSSQSYGVSGLVTASSFTQGKHASGKFDVTVGDQNDKIKGSFSAEFCDLGNVDIGNLNCE